jgi:hypothetical protein
MEGSMHGNIMVARGWVRNSGAATESASLECAVVFSLLGLAASAAVLLSASTETVAAITAALMI